METTPPALSESDLATRLTRGLLFALLGLLAGTMAAGLTGVFIEGALRLGRGEGLALVVLCFALIGIVGGVTVRRVGGAVCGWVIFVTYAVAVLWAALTVEDVSFARRWFVLLLSPMLTFVGVMFEGSSHPLRWWAGLIYLAASIGAAYLGLSLVGQSIPSLSAIASQTTRLAAAYGLSSAVFWGLIGCVSDLARRGDSLRQ